MKLGDYVTSEEIDVLVKEARGTWRYIIPLIGPRRQELRDYAFISEDKGKTWKCTRIKDQELEIQRLDYSPQLASSDRRKSPDYYTRWESTSGGRPKFNPVSGTGGPNGKKTLD